jgi:hypothetical protein
MRMLSWNCQGLGNPLIVRDIRQMVKEKGPHLVFLMETKLMNKKSDYLRIKLGFDCIFVVDCVGRSGGLMLLWKNEANLTIQNYSRRHINVTTSYGMDGEFWKITCFYGHPDTTKRKEAWALLRHLSNFLPSPWIVMGDFNEIVDLSEKRGGATRANGQMDDFRQTLEDCSLYDLGFMGPKFTWSNGQVGSNLIKERLDRVVANPEWCSKWPKATVTVLAKRSSDHHPIFIESHDGAVRDRQRGNIFRYDASWPKSEGFNDMIKETWSQGGVRGEPWTKVKCKLQRCKRSIQQWVRKNTRPTDALVREKTKALERIQADSSCEGEEDEQILKNEIHKLLEKDELQWKQRAKMDWLREGDQNTKFFHACVRQRQCRNRIEKIEDESGHVCTSQADVDQAFVKYYDNLFSTTGAGNITECVRSIGCTVTSEMNAQLTATFTSDEVHQALCQMAPLKAPGPDGFSASFFQQNWATVGPEVCSAVLQFLNCSKMDASINATHIALIPKKIAPSNVSEFRPISLCNVTYKLISKVLANRLKQILPFVISENQSAFIPGRLITDNVLAAYETLHSMHTRMWSKVGFMGIKLDMSKAYDRVE